MAASQTPRFRTDLVATPLEIEGKRFIDVTDPDSEQTFRFYEVEYSVACAMDGNRDMQGLVQWSKEELGLEPSLDELRTVVNTLKDLGYLAESQGSGGVELGSSGASPIAPPRPPSPAKPADVQLGAPGKGAKPPAIPPAGKVTMGWDAPPVDPKDLEALMGSDALGPAGVAAKAAEAAKPPATPPAGKVTMGWDAPPVDPKDLEALMGKTEPAEPVASLRPTTKPDSDEDGPTQIPAAEPDYDDEDLSVDLSDHLSIGTEDVKEAVRQSKTMDAVQVPDDLLAELDSGQSTKTGDELADSEPAVLKKAKADSSKPVALPDKPPKVTKKAEPKVPASAAAEAPVEPGKGGGGAIILFVVLIILAAGAAAYYFLVYKKQDDGATKPTSGQTEAGKPSEAGGAPVVSAKLAEAPPDAIEVPAVADGVIASIAVAGDEVDEGAVVASLKGVEQVERGLSRPRRKFVEYSEALKKAQETGASAKTIERLQAKVAEKQGLIDEGEAKLAALQMLAPTAGKVEPLVEAGAEVTKDTPVAKIVGEPGLSATLPTKQKFELGGDCQIALEKDPAKTIPCTVDAVETGKVTIRIGQDQGLAAGDAIILK